MARKLKGSENIEFAVDYVFTREKPLWVICADETEQDTAYITAINKIKNIPNVGLRKLNIVKSSTAIIKGSRYTMFPAVYISAVKRRVLQN